MGKRIVFRLNRGHGIVVEPRMTGLLLLADPPDQEHLRWRMRLSGSKVSNIWFWDRRGLGTLRLLPPTKLQEHFSRIGPDALDISTEQLRAQLGKSRREIKVALLDQHALAGVGNLYAAEILHVAGIHPRTRCHRLRISDWKLLNKSMRTVLREAIVAEGSTLSDGTYRNALNQSGTYQNQHRVYGRSGEACGNCRTDQIVRIVQSQRSTFFCPTCQPRSRSKNRGSGRG